MSGEEVALELIARISGEGPRPPEPRHDLVVDLGFTSLKALELVVELEEALRVQLREEDIEAWRTVGDVLSSLGHARPLPDREPG